MYKKNTVANYYKYQLILFCIVLGLMTFPPTLLFVFALRATGGDMSSGVGALLAVIGTCMLIWLPFVIYYLCQFVYYRRLEPEHVQTVRLVKTDSMFRFVGFEVTVTVDGTQKNVCTKRVFAAGMIGVNRLDDYAGQDAEIGYDGNRDEWVVLRKAGHNQTFETN